MKSRQTPTTRDIERVAEAVWTQTLECLVDDSAIMLIAVKRFFKLGPKRIEKFIAALDEVRAEFEEHDKDGRFRDKIEEELEAMGLDPKDVYAMDESFEAARKKYSNRDKPQFSIAEAYDMQRKLEAMKLASR